MSNPTHIYRDIAKRIAAKLKQTVAETIEQGKTPDLYWKLEQAIVDACRYADTLGYNRKAEEVEALLNNFDNDDGTSRN